MTSLALAPDPAAAARPGRDSGPEVDFRFYVGIHQPRLDWPLVQRGFRVCLSANVLRDRAGDIPFMGCPEPWLLDSGAFTQVALRGGFDTSPADYAALVRRYARTGLVAAATQDYMCEPMALKATGLNVRAHQALTLARYDAIPWPWRRSSRPCWRNGQTFVCTGSGSRPPPCCILRSGTVWPRPTASPGRWPRDGPVAIGTPGSRPAGSPSPSGAAPSRHPGPTGRLAAGGRAALAASLRVSRPRAIRHSFPLRRLKEPPLCRVMTCNPSPTSPVRSR